MAHRLEPAPWKVPPAKSGNISINATGTVAIGGENSAGTPSGLFSNSFGEGDAGKITVAAFRFFLEKGGAISANTTGSGKGGAITVRADELHATGANIHARTAGAGDAGDILLEGTNISFRDGAQVGTSAMEGSTGKSGNIRIDATGDITMSGRSSGGAPSGLFSDTHGEGDGGNITVTASNFFLGKGGGIASRTFEAGDAGKITVRTSEFSSKGGLIYSDTCGSGNGGEILLESENISLSDSAQIGVGALQGSTGNGGSITVNVAGSITITGKNSGLFSDTNSVGKAGNISVRTGNLQIADGGTISAKSTTMANAGSIDINSSNLLSLDNGTITTNAANALGGNINITGKDIQLTHNSGINANVKSGEGKGGNVTINASTLVLFGRKQYYR